MTGLLREWLLGIVGAAILAALADSLMPEGGVKQVGKLVCGLCLIAVVLRPLGRVEATDLSGVWGYDGDIGQTARALQEEADERMKTIIEERLSAYSMDKAAGLGLSCQVRVRCEPDGEGAFLPVAAEVTGAPESEQRRALQDILETDLGLGSGAVTFREEGPG